MRLTDSEKSKALSTLEKVIEKMSQEKSLATTHEDFADYPPTHFRVNQYTVKQKNGVYSVYRNEECLYDDIIVAEVVFKLLNRLITNKTLRIKDLLSYEREYVKHLNDMRFYLHSYKMSIKNDTGNSLVFHDRFEVSSGRAETFKKKIRKLG